MSSLGINTTAIIAIGRVAAWTYHATTSTRHPGIIARFLEIHRWRRRVTVRVLSPGEATF